MATEPLNTHAPKMTTFVVFETPPITHAQYKMGVAKLLILLKIII